MNKEQKKRLFDYVAKLVSYNEETGVFIWLERTENTPAINQWNKKYSNKEAGHIDANGYKRICVNFEGKLRIVKLHQLAWFISRGSLQYGQIDHFDQNRTNNSASNLRDVSSSENSQNRSIRSDCGSGITGVSWHKASKAWRARAHVDGKEVCIGLFSTKEEAGECIKKFRLNKGFTENHGRYIGETYRELRKSNLFSR